MTLSPPPSYRPHPSHGQEDPEEILQEEYNAKVAEEKDSIPISLVREYMEEFYYHQKNINAASDLIKYGKDIPDVNERVLATFDEWVQSVAEERAQKSVYR